MKIKTSKESLLKGLQITQSVVSAQSTLPILYNILIAAEKNKLHLSATDMTVSIKYAYETDVKKAGTSTLMARRLLGIIRELPQDELEIEIDEKDIATINCGSATYRIYGLPADDFPKFPSFESATSFTLKQDIFREMLRKTAYAVSTDDSRQVLNGLLLCFKDQKLTTVATDGRRLALVELEVEIPAEAQSEIIVPTKTIGELIKILGDTGSVKVQAMANMVAFETENVSIISKLIDGKFPNFRQVIPSQCEERVTVERESLLAALRRVALLTNDKFPSVKVSFEKNKMQIVADTPDVGMARETVPVKYSGKSITMALNPEFFMDPLRNLNSDEVYIELVDDLSPAVIKSNIPFLYVLMPLRIS